MELRKRLYRLMHNPCRQIVHLIVWLKRSPEYEKNCKEVELSIAVIMQVMFLNIPNLYTNPTRVVDVDSIGCWMAVVVKCSFTINTSIKHQLRR